MSLTDDDPSDELLALLVSPRRQLVLYHLGEAAGAISVGDLARRIAASERRSTVDSVDDGDLDRVYRSLSHRHLPFFAERGVVEYDEVEDVVRPTDRIEEFLRVIEDRRTSRRRWSLYYSIPAAILAGTVAVRGFGIVTYSDSVLSLLTFGGAVVAVLVASFHHAEARRTDRADGRHHSVRIRG